MDDLKYYLELIFKDEIEKVIISNPRLKSEAVRKITLEAKKDGWQIAGYTEKQVFHENIQTDMVVSKMLELAQGNFKQINAFSKTQEHMLLISKKRFNCLYLSYMAFTTFPSFVNTPISISGSICIPSCKI